MIAQTQRSFSTEQFIAAAVEAVIHALPAEGYLFEHEIAKLMPTELVQNWAAQENSTAGVQCRDRPLDRLVTQVIQRLKQAGRIEPTDLLGTSAFKVIPGFVTEQLAAPASDDSQRTDRTLTATPHDPTSGSVSNTTPRSEQAATDDQVPAQMAAEKIVTTEDDTPKADRSTIVMLKVQDLRLHPVVETIPHMRGMEWDKVRADILKVGVKDPILVQKGGIILDGRHRWETAKERGDVLIPARVMDLGEEEQVDEIYRTALLRRHLSDQQRSILAARWQKSQSQQVRQERARKAGQAGGRGRPKKNSLVVEVAHKLSGAQNDAAPAGPSTRAQAAAQANVTEHKVRQAMELDQTSPELADKVLSGTMSFREARKAIKAESSDKPETLKEGAQPTRKEIGLMIRKSMSVDDIAGKLIRYLGKKKAAAVGQALTTSPEAKQDEIS